jgi:hypothetical protein
MPAQLPLFANPQAVTFLPPPPPALTQAAWSPANWQEISEVGVEVGLPLVYAEKDLLHTLPDPEGAFLWDVLWTTHYHLEVLRENSARFTLAFGSNDYRFVAVHLLPAGVLVRLDSVQPG